MVDNLQRLFVMLLLCMAMACPSLAIAADTTDCAARKKQSDMCFYMFGHLSMMKDNGLVLIDESKNETNVIDNHSATAPSPQDLYERVKAGQVTEGLYFVCPVSSSDKGSKVLCIEHAALREGCMERATKTGEMTECAFAELRKAEVELEKIYLQLEKKTLPENLVILHKARESWETYRDLQCNFNVLGSRGAALHSFSLASCKARMTNDQVILLRAELKCDDSVVSCGGQ